MKPSYLFTKIFITGAIVLALELAASRILTPFFGVSLYVWSAILAVTLIALALGYKAGGILTHRLDHRRLLLFYAAAGALAALWLDLCVWTYPFIFRPLADLNLVFGSILACLYLLFVPLVILSALNPLLVALLAAKDKKGDHGAGSVFFISTIGSVLGVFIAAYAIMPLLSNYMTVVVLAGFSAGLSVFLLYVIDDQKHKDYRAALVLSVIALLLAVFTFASGGLERRGGVIAFEDAEWRIVHTSPSYFGQVQVVDVNREGRPKLRALFTDGLMQNQFMEDGASATLYTYALERLALAAAESAQRALVLGVGAGVVPLALAARGVDVHAVDISPEIVRVSEEYLGFDPSPIALSYQDARMAVRRCPAGYDIVVVDLFRGDGIPEHLTTLEFFGDIRACLRPGGVMVMNTFMSLSHPESEQALVKTIARVFGDVLFIQKPPQNEPDFTAGYIVTRKGGKIGPLRPDLSGMPRFAQNQLAHAMNNARIMRMDDAELKSAPVLTDISNQWKHLAYPAELAYRRSIASRLPWQLLMN